MNKGLETIAQRAKRAIVLGVLIAGIMFVCLLLMFLSHNGYAITCVAASAFIVFVYPLSKRRRYRNLVGGYACGVGAGLLTHFAMLGTGSPGDKETLFVIIGCAIAVFIASFLMVLLDCPHPPAAALAATLMIDLTPLYSAWIAMVCILLVCVVKSIIDRINPNKQKKAEANPQPPISD